MTNGMKSQEEQEVLAQVQQVRERLQALKAELRVVDDELENLAPQRKNPELLDQACSSLENLDELGAASLFWGERFEPARASEQLREVRGRMSAFQEQLDEFDKRRQAILAKISFEEDNLEILGDDLYHLRQAEERQKLEWVVERDMSPVTAHPQLMAWARGGEDDARFRRALAVALMLSLLFGVLLPMIELPLPKQFTPEDLPRRLVQFVRQEKAKRFPPPVVEETAQEQIPPEEQEQDPVEDPEPSEQPVPEDPTYSADASQFEEPDPSAQTDQFSPEEPAYAAAEPQQQRQVEKAGILAFRDKFASLAEDEVAPRLGADARYGNADEPRGGQAPSRSMLTTNAPGSSGGINIASLSLGVGGGGGGGGGGQGSGGGIQGVPLGRPTSSIASIGPGGRPSARGGPGPSRTDEEIQIVFDRYKARFYRIYNRELRNDPTLQGQMVLSLTIEPDGSVSICKLRSSDMDAPDLAAQVVQIVRTINFGAKDGVKAMTIVYPIDFLPAST
jgi:outer membrane biosynthesis protein TonB